MNTDRPGSLRISASRFEVTACDRQGVVIEVGLDITAETAHVLRHLMASHVDATAGHRRPCATRSLLHRALSAVGAVPDHIEVFPGEPPRFDLVVVGPDGCLRRIDLDLADTAELVLVSRLQVSAVGWPERDWDAGLATLLEAEGVAEPIDPPDATNT